MDKEDIRETRVFDEKFQHELLLRLNDFRKANFKCDTTIRAEGQDFAAHSIVLSAASDYFRALFASELKGKQKQDNFVELDNLKSAAIAEILQFIYTGEASISSSNAQDLLVASDYLIIPSLKSKAAQFLGESLNASNCLSLESFACQYNCDSIRQVAMNCKCEHFVEVVKSEDFLALGFEQVKELVCRDELNISEEEQVYEAVMAWVKHDLFRRVCFLPDLLRCLRLFSMSKYSLWKILNKEELVTKDPICTTVLVKGLEFFLFPDQFLSKSLKHRASIMKEDRVVVLSGGYENAHYYNVLSREISCFVLATRKCRTLCRMPDFCLKKSSNTCVSAVLGGCLYLMGDKSATVSHFDPRNKSWTSSNTEFPCHVTIDFTVTSFNEDLYLIGGQLKSGGVTYEAHKYNPFHNEWKQLASMETGRAGHCAVVLEDLIYVIGGHDTHTCLKSVECYDPLSNQWRKVPDVTNARRFAAAAAACRRIVVVGGFCEMGALTEARLEPTCEMFDPCQNEWSLVSSPKVPHAGCGIVSVDDTVYVFGGENEEDFLDSVECFNVKHNEWHEVDATLPKALSFVQASLLKLPEKFTNS